MAGKNIGQFTPKQRDILTAVRILVAMAVFGGLYLHFFFWSSSVKNCKAAIQTAETDNRIITVSLREIQEKLDNQDEIKRKAQYVTQVASMLPSSTDAPGFLNDLAEALQTTTIDYTRLKPNEPDKQIGYTELPYNIVCDGRFHDFGQFLNLIEASPKRFMRIKSFEIGMNNERPSLHPVQLSIATFFLTKIDNDKKE